MATDAMMTDEGVYDGLHAMTKRQAHTHMYSK